MKWSTETMEGGTSVEIRREKKEINAQTRTKQERGKKSVVHVNYENG